MEQKEIYGIIYMVKNKINNKLYFGQTTCETFDERYHGGLLKTHNQHLKRSFEKYGIENFEINKMFDVACSQDELDKLEDMYICLYDTLNPKFGYNKRRGGSHGKHTEETKRKISKKNKNRKRTQQQREKISSSMKGRYVSEETRQKMSEAQKGENHPFYGKKHTDETKKKMSETRNKKVSQFTLDGHFIKEYDSLSQAASETGINIATISLCCNGKTKTGSGFIWKRLF